MISDVVENRRVLVVYHLHGQTGRCTVWANHGKQNFRTVKFRPIIALTICTNRYLPTNGREGLKTGIKYRTRSSFAPGNFRPERRKTSCSVYFLTGFSRKLFVNGKPPLSRPSAFLRVSA